MTQQQDSNPDPSPLGSLSKRDFLRLAPLGLLVGMTGTAQAAHNSSSPFPDGAWGVETIVGHGTSERPSISELESAWSETYHFLFVDVDSGDRYYAEHGDNEWSALSSGGLSTIVVDDTDSPYVTQDEDIIYVDDSTAAVTVTLATADATVGNEIEIVLLDGTNGATVNTEGSETIDPNGESSKSITKPGWEHAFTWNNTAWETSELIQRPVSFPDSASADADRQTIIGHNATAQSTNIDDGFDKSATVIGDNASGGDPSQQFPTHGRVVIGDSATTNNYESTVIGSEASAVKQAIAIGAGATASGFESIIIGTRVSQSSPRSVVIGPSAQARSNSVGIGWQANGHDGVSIGRGAGIPSKHFTPQVAIGNNAQAGSDAVAVGGGAEANNASSIAIGRNVTVDTDNVARVGGNQLVFGGVMDTIADADLNPSEITFDIDEINNELIARVKYSDGTIKTGQTPLS